MLLSTLYLYAFLSLPMVLPSTAYLWKIEPSLFQNRAVQLEPVTLLPWQDVPKTHWAYPYLLDLYQKGILRGLPGSSFEGQRPLTRYEAAVMIDRTIIYLNKLFQQP